MTDQVAARCTVEGVSRHPRSPDDDAATRTSSARHAALQVRTDPVVAPVPAWVPVER